jgi:dipeptidyl aminopeptidase/acylaminoacyl peptidase
MANSSQSADLLTEQSTDGKKVAAYGGWLSPIDPILVAGGALRLSQPMYGQDGQSLYFIEGRPSQGGRQVLVRRPAGANPILLEDVSPEGVGVRTLVHEYGGGAFAVAGEYAFYVDYSDQRVYMIRAGADLSPAGDGPGPVAISPEGDFRYADLYADQTKKLLLAVMEDHTEVKSGQAAEPKNSIVALSYAAAETWLGRGDHKAEAAVKPAGAPVTLAQGFDFYAFPRLSPDGTKLAYIRWNHPNLPWDDSQLVLADLGPDGLPVAERVVAGGDDCSVFQPQWGPDGKLYFVCDSSGFWNLYAVTDFKTLEAKTIVPKVFAQCEFGLPMWVFGQSTYVVAADNLIICAVNRRGLWHLARLELDFQSHSGHKLVEIPSPYTDFAYLALGANRVAMLAGSAERPSAVVEFDWSLRSFTTIRSSAGSVPPSGYLARPEVIEFPTENGKTAFAFYYPPTNEDYRGPDGALPPLLVKCHGGPTGSASSALSLGLQFWTSRGFAVVDVNYGGSTGFGREYRKRLNGQWGVVDVDDCVNAVKFLVKEGRVDKERVAISGGSAGGFTVLCALTFKDVFSAGASHYGIGDLEALVRDTHKFEARYGDNLVGPYPQAKSVYMERSPINHIDRLKCPVIFFQGLEDKVVPPNQAEAMVEALNAKKIPVAYIAYEGEQHGFRQAANIIRTMEAELFFFRTIFKIESAEVLNGVAIRNLSD